MNDEMNENTWLALIEMIIKRKTEKRRKRKKKKEKEMRRVGEKFALNVRF